MNSSGRIVGGLLIAIATAWILSIAGVFPFNTRTANQLATTNRDRTPVSDANAQRPNTQANQQSNQGTGTAPLNTQQPTTSAQADNANQGTTGTTVPFDANNPNSTDPNATGTTSQTSPAIPAGW
ncbi:hypothetical protein ACKFKG_26960 [Phormidesmis sp. 146-35]